MSVTAGSSSNTVYSPGSASTGLRAASALEMASSAIASAFTRPASWCANDALAGPGVRGHYGVDFATVPRW